ncbi:uncharacterized protein MYCGRDRAFT_90708 [Zymoseptoria tritici IPO323]|uniref:Uncharacterized protein n=1 Tax=Zymoseptoria tritici (strain CBS 115943 / IPO323) TaxID=336722 RepID=F9X2B5_ZYMTI|nr:uncharacterized protein MYCGRDRAFT_90708 [Zymoseptoria tritici IPO323]EGP89892.1 hypothetical protein MYCGRDRAFT_90708 [Zymoseptoria tritici IPO323]
MVVFSGVLSSSTCSHPWVWQKLNALGCYGNVIGGLSSKIDREASDGKEVSLVSSLKPRVRSNSSRVLSSKYGKDSETKLRFITAQSDQADDRPGSDFIEITRAKRREHDYDGADDQSGSVDYRSIDGKAKANDPSIDDDLEVVDSDDNASTDLELRTRQESAVLSKKAKANPKSLEAWLALAEHQSKLVRPGIDVSSLTSSERRTLADLRLSIFNEASKHISPGTAGRESLLSAMVDEGRLVWDNAKLASKWKEALVEQNSSVLLWAKYLNFVQDSQSNFRYETCKHAYVECLNILHRACESANDASRPEISRIQIYLLLRFTVFVRGAGYDELAIAIWQALIEMHFFAPSSLSSAGVSERLSSLEEFWESEVARVGEENSLGWAKYHDSGEGTPRESQPAVKDKTVLCNSLQNFADEENTLGSAFLLPASTYDDDAVTDPFRCVMFSDIREVIEPLSNTKIQSWSIVESFFHFMRLPAISLQSIHLDACEWQRDSHLATSPGENSSFAATPQPERCLLPCRREMTAILFEDGFDALKSDLEQQPMRDTKLRFLDRVLESLGSVSTLNTPNGELLAEYYIAFKATLLPTETAKAAKRILKQRPSSMRLYNAYALAEGRSQMAKALEIWSAALSLQRRIESNQHHDLIYLWHSRFICQVKSGDERGALQLLLDTANGNKECIGVEDQSDHASEFSTRQLRLLRRIEEDLDRLYLLGRFEHAVLCADLLAWISYLTTENNTDRPLHIYSKYSAKFARDKGSIAIEQLHQCKVRLIQTHLERHRPHKPSVLQQELEDSLELFPDNSVLLELHARIATQDRIRALVREQKATSSISSFSVVQWAFKIGEEIRRSAHETSGSTSNTGGWHPGGGKGDSSGSASSTTGVRGKLSELKGKATGKPVDRHNYDAARSHQSAPLSSLRDLASFAPPPKHSAYYGDGAQSPAVTRTVTSSSVAAANKPAPSLGAPLVETGYAARRAAEQRERQEQAELEAAKPKGPYRSDTSGLRTDNLPPPPVKRVTANVSGGNGPTPSPARRASPALPPRVPPRQAAPPPSLPPRQNEYPDEHTPAPPPAYQEAISQPTTQTPSAPVAPPRQAGMINQFAANRLGQAGVNVSGFGIGGETSSTANNSAANPAQPARDYRSQIGQMGALHQRYQNSNANNTSAGSSQAAGGYGQQVGELQQRFSKMNTGNSNAPSSSSHAQTAQNAFSGIAAAVQKKPPPPPPKKSGLAAPPQPVSASPSAGLAPPPLPLGKQHLVLHVSWTYQSRLSRTKEQPVWISADQISYMPPNPTIVIVPETWCPPSLYDPLTLRLERAGYRVWTVFLPSTGDKILAKWGTEDVDIIAATIRHCDNRGEDIVVVAHGAGAASAGDAVSGLSKADRVEQGTRGVVVRSCGSARLGDGPWDLGCTGFCSHSSKLW